MWRTCSWILLSATESKRMIQFVIVVLNFWFAWDDAHRWCQLILSTIIHRQLIQFIHSIEICHFPINLINIDFCCNNLLNWYYLNEKKRTREIEWQKSNEGWRKGGIECWKQVVFDIKLTGKIKNISFILNYYYSSLFWQK